MGVNSSAKRCAFPECRRKVKDLNLCMTHWFQYLNDPTGVLQPHRLDLLGNTWYARAASGSEPTAAKKNRELRAKRTHAKRLPAGNRKDLPCSFEGCDHQQSAKGLCGGHYLQQHEGKELRPLRRRSPRIPRDGNCLYTGCGRIVAARGYCQPHYAQLLAGEELTALNDMAPFIPECAYPGCTKPGRSQYCPGHQAQQRRHGQMSPLRKT